MIIRLLFDSIFLGFAWFSIILVINRISIKNQFKVLGEAVDNSAIYLVRYTGLLFLIYTTFSSLGSIRYSEYEKYSIINRMFGSFWFGFWIYPFAYSVLTQLLWVKGMRSNNAIRLLIALILIIALSIEKLIILVTSLNRDYIESGWTFMIKESIGTMVSNWLLKLLIFATLVLITNFFLQKRKHEIPKATI